MTPGPSSRPGRQSTAIFLFALLCVLSPSFANGRSKISSSPAFIFAPFERIQKDFLALTRKATARHILLPKSNEAALALKQKIRYAAEEKFIVDVFEDAALRYSLDSTTAQAGGLLGPADEPTPQGYCSCPELDEARFSVPLAQVAGPIESDFGYHLVLVTERTNCPKLDNGNTRVVRGGENGATAVLAGPPEGESSTTKWIEFASGQILFWIVTFVAGGFVAELAANTATLLQNNQLPEI